jgi:hypothetical protein
MKGINSLSEFISPDSWLAYVKYLGRMKDPKM